MIACLLVSLPAVFGAATWLTLRWGVSVPELSVSELTGRPLAAVKQELESQGLECEVSSRRFHEEEPEGNVLEQFPGPGTRLQPGRKVRVVVSRGPERILVPVLGGSSLRRATLALSGAKLERGLTSEVHHDEVGLGRIVAQSPPPGTEAFPGDEVALLVSAGPRAQAWVMPDLTGRPLSAVKRLLRKIEVTRLRVSPSDAPPESLITAQKPQPGGRITAEDRVELRAAVMSRARPPEGEQPR
jgi:serine/threonine-protein kinase